MKKRNLFFSLIFLFLTFHQLNAQPPCGFDFLHSQLLAKDAAYARQININEASIQRYIAAHPELLNRTNSTEALFTIPVVIHVMHTGGAVGTIYNPSDAQLLGAINYLNQVFAGTYPGMQQPVEGGGVVNMELQFALAQRTPSCGFTNGINRVDATSLSNYTANGVNAVNSSGCPELTMKNFARWNPSDYYNIWIVNKIDGADGTSGQFIAGYAYFPGASSSVDGTVMLATQMISGQKTLPHEIGHAFNLYHTFEGSANNSQCPSNTNCNTQGDRICDTDPVFNNYNAGTGIYNFSCRSGPNTCASPNNYTINTESNFMSYTTCYTLFTNGQKARTQAAMSLSSRASLVAPGNLALVPCASDINFSQASASQSENIAGTVSGCRRFTDHTYQMTIGAAPTANATATLALTGSATVGLDYDITTNGDFISPSNVLNFNSGATIAQPFTIRIYDDGNVESSETIIINFSVNDGGGNAAKGSTTPTLSISISDNDIAPSGTSTGTFSIGSNDLSIDGGPFDATLQSQRGQYLYRANELSAAGITAGTISTFQLFVNGKFSTRPFSNFSIKMAHTSLNNLIDGSIYVVGGMTTVFSPASVTSSGGWNSFTLSTPFDWNGTDNLAVEICFDNGSPDGANNSDDLAAYFDGGTASQGNMFFENGINCSGSFSSVSYYPNGIKPMIRLGVSVSGSNIETTAGSTSATHIAVGSQDYFYSNNNKLLFRLNNVNADLGCVNASLEAGGTTWVNALGGQRSAKVFAITPTTNISTTGYTISLYFDNAELGGKNPASIRIAKTTAASANGANSSNTVFVNPTLTTLGSGITVFTAPFTGFSRFFLVDAGATLPVSLVAFTATPNEQKNTIINWKTSSEFNNKEFTLEVSTDDLNFIPLATIPSKGNSTSLQEYEYLHLKPAKGITRYRLKQTDWDDHFKYSKIVLASIIDDKNKISIYPVPANDQITINFRNMTSKISIDVYNTAMKLIMKEQISGPTLIKDINVSSLSPGLYFIKISSPTGISMMQFIKN